jgi:formylglycine-generating enzyme required for sulfatase activity
MDQAGWYVSNSGGGPHPVAQKRPNSLKLYDMHGNAAEWCWDVAATLEAGETRNPRGPDSGEFRIVRGGSWSDPARACRAAARGRLTPDATPDREVGFRLVRPR